MISSRGCSHSTWSGRRRSDRSGKERRPGILPSRSLQIAAARPRCCSLRGAHQGEGGSPPHPASARPPLPHRPPRCGMRRAPGFPLPPIADSRASPRLRAASCRRRVAARKKANRVAPSPVEGVNTCLAVHHPGVFEMANQWFIRSGEKVYGPMDAANLKNLATSGKITKTTEVAQAKDGPWHRAAIVKGLFPNDSVVPTPPAPPGAAIAPAASVQTPISTITARFHPKHWYRRWWAKWIVIPFLAVMALGLVIQLTVPQETLDRWEAEAKERQRQREASRPAPKPPAKDSKSKESPPGFTFGFLTGAVSARDGARKPSSDELDAIARRAATQNNVPENERSLWIHNFKQAFWMGWRKGQ